MAASLPPTDTNHTPSDAGTTCPSWCSTRDCRGDHSGLCESVPASGGGILWHAVASQWTAAHVPVVTVRLVLSDRASEHHDGPSIALHVQGVDHDETEGREVEVNLRPEEARGVAVAILGRLSDLTNEAKR